MLGRDEKDNEMIYHLGALLQARVPISFRVGN
jgi:hypothetical protein